jgi:hypothetical protein
VRFAITWGGHRWLIAQWHTARACRQTLQQAARCCGPVWPPPHAANALPQGTLTGRAYCMHCRVVALVAVCMLGGARLHATSVRHADAVERRQ